MFLVFNFYETKVPDFIFSKGRLERGALFPYVIFKGILQLHQEGKSIRIYCLIGDASVELEYRISILQNPLPKYVLL